MSADGQSTKWRRNITENINLLSRAHERYRRQTDRRTDGRRHSRSLKIISRQTKGSLTVGSGRRCMEAQRRRETPCSNYSRVFIYDSNLQGWARDVKARDRDETFVALEAFSRR